MLFSRLVASSILRLAFANKHWTDPAKLAFLLSHCPKHLKWVGKIDKAVPFAFIFALHNGSHQGHGRIVLESLLQMIVPNFSPEVPYKQPPLRFFFLSFF